MEAEQGVTASVRRVGGAGEVMRTGFTILLFRMFRLTTAILFSGRRNSCPTVVVSWCHFRQGVLTEEGLLRRLISTMAVMILPTGRRFSHAKFCMAPVQFTPPRGRLAAAVAY